MHERDGFSAKTLGKSLFHFQTDWSGKGPAGQFWQMESAQSKDNLTMARADLTNWPMAERQIEHRRSCSVLSPRLGVLIWRCDVFAKSALRKLPILEYISLCKLLRIQGKITFMYMYVCPMALSLVNMVHTDQKNQRKIIPMMNSTMKCP